MWVSCGYHRQSPSLSGVRRWSDGVNNLQYRRLDLLHSLIFLPTFFLNDLHPSFYTWMNQWRIQGRGPGGPGSPFPSSPALIFGRPSPLSPPLSPLPSPLISRSGSGTVNIATVSMDRMALRSPVQYPSAVWLCMFVFELPFFSPPMCRRPKRFQWEEYSWILSVHFS